MNIVDRAKNILLTPKTEWPVIAGEAPDIGQILMGYVVPLAAIAAVAGVVGRGVIGEAGYATTFAYGLAYGIMTFLVAVAGVYIAAYVVDFLAPTFGSEKNLGRSIQLVAYASTPGWVAGILNIIPSLSVIVLIANLYGVYLLYLGLAPVKKTPQDKLVPYLVVSIIAVLVVYVILGLILGGIVFGLFGVSRLGMTVGM
jgi:hypothetical protein